MPRTKEQNNNYTICKLCNKPIKKQQIIYHYSFRHLIATKDIKDIPDNLLYILKKKKFNKWKNIDNNTNTNNNM